jgi:glycosyltransferase involved in cell wall biosynthesis
MLRTAPADRPLVSAVTPFYNTAPYLAQCIESVLAQTYSHFEYILMDNCSTDGSSEIAEIYARRDPRIRFIRCSQFLSQLGNYNRALAEISENSQYCKIVEADNYIFPDCLRMMLEAFGQSEGIGLVSSYCLEGNDIKGSGYPFPMTRLSGKEAARQYLRSGPHVFGSATTVMYRSSLVRHQQPFFNEALPHSDTEKCMEILEHWDFGFVHQILSFLRIDNESISSAFRAFQPFALDRYIITQRYASTFLGAAEATSLKGESKRKYYRVLAREAIGLRSREFWRHHREGLKTLGERIDWRYLALSIGQELLWLASNPGMSARRALRSWKETGRTQQGDQKLAASHTAPQCGNGSLSNLNGGNINPLTARTSHTSCTKEGAN